MQEQEIVCQKCRSYNMKKQFGISSPYGLELYLFISEVILSKMIEYKPDIIICIEDFDCNQVSIDPQVRGLILNDFSAKVQNKIYVFKEVGFTEDMKQQGMI